MSTHPYSLVWPKEVEKRESGLLFCYCVILWLQLPFWWSVMYEVSYYTSRQKFGTNSANNVCHTEGYCFELKRQDIKKLFVRLRNLNIQGCNNSPPCVMKWREVVVPPFNFLGVWLSYPQNAVAWPLTPVKKSGQSVPQFAEIDFPEDSSEDEDYKPSQEEITVSDLFVL